MIPLENIDNVIFDLGGVVIDLDRQRAVDALVELGIASAPEMLGLYAQQPPFLYLETGRLTAGEFFDVLRADARPGVSDTDLQNAFNRFLISIPEERLDALRRMRRDGFRIFVLSNTNAVMYNSWIARAFRAQGLTIKDYFDGIVTSFEEGMCKPDVELFKVPLRRYSLLPEATVMLDDSEANCEAARQAGMRAVRVTPELDMISICHSIREANR